MKKILRLSAFALVTAFVFLSLCGCQALDDVKKNRAVWSSDDSTSFKLNGEEYIKLPEYEFLQPSIDYEDGIFVTEEDVPVLLSAVMGEPLYKDTTGYFYVTDNEYEREDYTMNYYCRKDKYDETLGRIENYSKNGFTADTYCYSYYLYDEETVKYYLFTDEQRKAVDTVLATAEGTVLPGEMNILYDYYISVEECSSDIVFKNSKIDMYVKDNEYFISEEIAGKTVIYTVPAEYNSVFADIMAEYIKAETYLEY